MVYTKTVIHLSVGESGGYLPPLFLITRVSAYSGFNCHLKAQTWKPCRIPVLGTGTWARVATVRDQWEYYFPTLFPTGVQKKLLMMIPPGTIQDTWADPWEWGGEGRD